MGIVVLPDNTVLVKLAHINRVPLLAHIGDAQMWCYTVSVECAKSSARVPGLTTLSTDASAVFGTPLTPTGAERTDANLFRDQMTAEGDRHLAGKNHGEAETNSVNTWTVIRLLHKKGHLTGADAWTDCEYLRSIGEGWPPCGQTRSQFIAWLTR